MMACPVGLEVLIITLAYKYVHNLSIRAVKVLAIMCICTGLQACLDLFLLDNTITTIIQCTTKMYVVINSIDKS